MFFLICVYICHTQKAIMFSWQVLVVISAWTELAFDLTNFTNGGSNAGVRILKAAVAWDCFENFRKVSWHLEQHFATENSSRICSDSRMWREISRRFGGLTLLVFTIACNSSSVDLMQRFAIPADPRQVFKFTRLLQGLRSLRIIRFIGGLRILVNSMLPVYIDPS